VWLGVSVEDQKHALRRIPLLSLCPAALRFLSCEPLLEEVTLNGIAGIEDIGWVIVGGESGPKARPFDAAWARAMLLECQNAEVPFFLKQMGTRGFEKSEGTLGFVGPEMRAAGYEPGPIVFKRGWKGKGADPSIWPEDLQVREFPA
jgi:protein gp37